MQACLLYIEINRVIKEVKYKQLPGFLSQENKFDQRRCNFKKMPFSLLEFSDENDVAKLVVDMRRNCSNRLCELTLPKFNAFSNFSISLIF